MSTEKNVRYNCPKSHRDDYLPVAAMSCGNGCNLPISQKAAGRNRGILCSDIVGF